MDQEPIVQTLAEQATDLCQIQDHITRVVANLDVDEEWFAGYDDPERANFDLEPIVLTFIYQYARDFTQSALARRLRGAAYVWVRFDLQQPIIQQSLSHNWRNRFDAAERSTIKRIGKHVQ